MRNSARTLKSLRKYGYHAEVCEKYITRPQGKGQAAKFAGGYRKDLFGFLDVIGFRADRPGVIGVQVTSKQQISKHMRDYRRNPVISRLILDWIKAGNRFWLHGWEKRQEPCKTREGTKARWSLTVVEVLIDSLTPNAKDIAWMETNSRTAAGGE